MKLNNNLILNLFINSIIKETLLFLTIFLLQQCLRADAREYIYSF